MITEQERALVTKAMEGDRESLERLLAGVQDMVFNLSLRMLGTVSDAEDASQEIYVKLMTNLSGFRQESRFETWAYRVTVNFLLNYKKSRFYRYPLDFDFYGADIDLIKQAPSPEEWDGGEQPVDAELLSEELKLSCTNVMLQCLDAESRCIFVLGTMFQPDSRTAGEVLGMTAENYRQKLSRVRKKMSEFLSTYCGLSETGFCSCKKRIGHAVKTHRLDPEHLEYHALEQREKELLETGKAEMEKMDVASQIFGSLPQYRSTVEGKAFVERILKSPQMKTIEELGGIS